MGKFRVGAGLASYTPSPMAPIAAMVRRSTRFNLGDDEAGLGVEPSAGDDEEGIRT